VGKKIERGILLSFSSRLNTQTLLALTVSETPWLPLFYHTRRMYGYRWGLGETCMYIYILCLQRFNRPEKDRKLLYNPFSVLPLFSQCVLRPPATNSRFAILCIKKILSRKKAIAIALFFILIYSRPVELLFLKYRKSFR